MRLEDIGKLAKAAGEMAKTIPVTHPDYYTIHKAPDKIDVYLADYVQLEKFRAVKEYIDKKDISKADSEQYQKSIERKEATLAEATKLKTSLDDINLDYHLTQAVEKAGAVNPKFTVEVVKELQNVEVREVNGQNEVFINGQRPDDFLKTFAKNPDYEYLFSEEKAQQVADMQKGDKSGFASGPNPWADETFNLTRQGQIHRADPELAKKMAAAAGKEI